MSDGAFSAGDVFAAFDPRDARLRIRSLIGGIPRGGFIVDAARFALTANSLSSAAVEASGQRQTAHSTKYFEV